MGRMKTRLVISLGIFGVLFTGFGITQTAFEMKPAKDYSSVSSYVIRDKKGRQAEWYHRPRRIQLCL